MRTGLWLGIIGPVELDRRLHAVPGGPRGRGSCESGRDQTVEFQNA